MDIWRSLSGLVQVQLISPEPQALVNDILQSNVEVMDLHDENDLTVTAKVRRKDVKKIREIAGQHGADIKVVGRSGVFWTIRRTVLRPAVVLCVALLFITVFYFPGRIFFVQVEGNERVATNLILDCAEKCGIGFGSIRGDVRSERVKNMLLSEIPQLQWIGINTQGCTAIITVRERSADDLAADDHRVCNIVALCDGVVDQCTVYKGNPLCKPGSAVKAGQVLVSGFTDCGITIQATHADAEIYGTTKRELNVITPTQMNVCTPTGKVNRKYTLIIGKKQIKFYKGSGISGAGCVKMKKIKYLTLPGGYRLPVALVTELVQTYKQTEVTTPDADWVEAYAENYLRSKMISGRILNSSVFGSCSSEVYLFSGTYDCYEIIGIPKYEETIE